MPQNLGSPRAHGARQVSEVQRRWTRSVLVQGSNLCNLRYSPVRRDPSWRTRLEVLHPPRKHQDVCWLEEAFLVEEYESWYCRTCHAMQHLHKDQGWAPKTGRTIEAFRCSNVEVGKHIYGLLFTPKFGKKNAGPRSFQDCVNQGIDCIRIDISWFRNNTRIGSLRMMLADNDNELWLASGNTCRTLQKGKD